jgi:hypothetical protein
MSRGKALAVLVGLLLVGGVGHAAVQKGVPEEFPGKNEISLHIGGSDGFANVTPGGFLFIFDYGRRLGEMVWLDIGFDTTFGFGGCGNAFAPAGCGYGGNGDMFAPHVGVKLKWKTPIPLVPYAKFVGDVIFIFNRFYGDNGFGLAGTAAGGVKYFLTPHIGVGGELGITLGPAFYGQYDPNFCDPRVVNCGSHSEFLVSGYFTIGAEFIF